MDYPRQRAFDRAVENADMDMGSVFIPGRSRYRRRAMPSERQQLIGQSESPEKDEEPGESPEKDEYVEEPEDDLPPP